MIAEKPNQITRLDERFYKVASQSGVLVACTSAEPIEAKRIRRVNVKTRRLRKHNLLSHRVVYSTYGVDSLLEIALLVSVVVVLLL
jgi:hypothetical protein